MGSESPWLRSDGSRAPGSGGRVSRLAVTVMYVLGFFPPPQLFCVAQEFVVESV